MKHEVIYDWMDYAAKKLQERLLPDIDIDDWMWNDTSFQFVFILNASSRTNEYITDPHRFCYDAEEEEEFGRTAYQQIDEWIENMLYGYLKH